MPFGAEHIVQWQKKWETVKEEKNLSFLGLPGSYYDTGPASPYDGCRYQAAPFLC